ncbi:MAG: antitoxin [Actinomycetales bacterium]|nr:antitoxin [Actinomycetales bacterium]
MARTTVALDADVESMLARLMAERGISFKEALNSTLRRGLTATASPVDVSFPTVAMGAPLVDLTHALRLAGELEDDEIARELAAGR